MPPRAEVRPGWRKNNNKPAGLPIRQAQRQGPLGKPTQAHCAEQYRQSPRERAPQDGLERQNNEGSSP